jgi:transcriptional regulator with AAA-type ATPase domain
MQSCQSDGGDQGSGPSDERTGVGQATWPAVRETTSTGEYRPRGPDDDDALTMRDLPRLILAIESGSLERLGCRLMLGDLDQVIVGRSTAPEVAGVRRIERSARSAIVWVRDLEASRQHFAVRRRGSFWQIEDLESRNGTLLNGTRVKSSRLNDGDVLEAGGALFVFRDGKTRSFAAVDRDLARRGAAALPVPPAFQTLSIELDARIEQAKKIAPSTVPVLVRGETGTGKELMARAIHDASGRTGAFMPVNCGALPRDLVESELFGYRRGAFSGASEDREGLVRRAHKGTLFLDEIAELPPDSQVALLRVLQEGEVRPVGSSETVKVDVRIIAATHQDLEQRIIHGQFRQDLYGRIAGFEVGLPALRDRREDLGMLIAGILGRIAAPHGAPVTLHKGAARALFRYPWPLNIRELEQSLSAAVALSDGGQIRIEDLPAALRDYDPPDVQGLSERDRVLRERVVDLMRKCGGNIAAVGRAMDRAPVQIRRWCQRLNIDPAQFRS